MATSHRVNAVLLLLLTTVVAGCASQQLKFDTINRRDRLRFAACRHDVARRICPDDPDCEIRAAEMFADEQPTSRVRWLVDYGCPVDKIRHADAVVREQERRAIGMQ